MKGKRLKKWLAAMLCAVMLFTQSAAVLANGVDFLTPETTQTGGQTEGQTGGQTEGQTGGQTEGQTGGQTEGQTGGQTEGQTGGQTEGQTGGQTDGQTDGQPDVQAEEPENVLEYAGAAAQASDYGQSSGVIHGSAEFTGNLAMVIKLYNADGKLDEAILQENGTFRFSGLSAGEYTLRFYFYGQGSGDPEKTISCTVAQKPAPEPEGDPDAGENPDGENPDGEDPDNGNPDDGDTGDGNKPGVSAEYRNGGVYITVTGVTEDTTVTVLNSNGGSVASAVVNAQNSALRLMLDPGTYTIQVADAQTTVTVPAEEGDGNNGNNGSNDNNGNDNNGNDNNGNDNNGNNNNSSDGSNGGAEDADGKFNVNVAQSKGMITVHVTDALAQAVIVVLSKPDGSNDMATLENGSGKAYFADLQQGDYMVTASYISGMTDYVVQQNVALAEGADTSSGSGDTGSGDTGDDNGTGGVAAGAIVATASAGTNRVDVSVTAASQMPVAVTLLKNGVIQNTQRIEAGVGSVSFTSIAAGTYSVSVNYAPSQPNVMPYQIDQLVVTDSVKGIAITSVTGGENKLTVTGTAHPGLDVLLTTEPAIPAAIVRTDANGSFSATLICSPGTYTAVHAQYGADVTSRVSASGPFVVKAPVARPPIAVNVITEKDSTVTARTNPGTIVNLGTYDYGQTLTADERGMLQFSLPHEYVNGTKVTFTVYYGSGKEHSYQHVVTVGYSQSYTLLKRGDTGYAVYDLTARLADLGYLKKPQNGYDEVVAAAVKQFQANNGLAVDGIAGQLTQTALWSVAAIGAYESGIYPTLVRGDRGLALIYTLQQRLKDLGYYTIRVDGIFGSGTQRAVRDFQAVNGLPVTGKADHTTQVLLYSAAAKPVGSYTGTGGYATLSRSSRYDARVVPMQRRLKALGYYAGSVDGYFGSQTYRAVRYFQQRNGIAVTGIADAYTQQVLYSAAAKTYAGSTAGTTAGTGYRLLYWGCKGEDVKRLQNALLSAGYKQVRTADGIYGQWTYDAVCAFQKDHGLAVDGVAGKNTQNRLYGTSY